MLETAWYATVKNEHKLTDGFDIENHPEVKGVKNMRCPTCKNIYSNYLLSDDTDDFFANELHIWDLLDEVEGYRRGVAITHLAGNDPVDYFRDRWHGLLPREFIAESRERMLIAAKKNSHE